MIHRISIRFCRTLTALFLAGVLILSALTGCAQIAESPAENIPPESTEAFPGTEPEITEAPGTETPETEPLETEPVETAPPETEPIVTEPAVTEPEESKTPEKKPEESITPDKKQTDSKPVTAKTKDPGGVKVEKITITAPRNKLTVNKTLTLTADISPKNVSDPGIEWTSSDPAVATVDKNGKMIGLKSGTVTVTAKAKDGSGVKAVITVPVEDAAPEPKRIQSINIKVPEEGYLTGDTIKLEAEILPADADNPQIKWSVVGSKGFDSLFFDPCDKVASVTSDGTLTAHIMGVVKVHAEALDGSGAKADAEIPIRSQYVVNFEQKSGALPAAPYTPVSYYTEEWAGTDLYRIRESFLIYDWITPDILPSYYPGETHTPCTVDFVLKIEAKLRATGAKAPKGVKLAFYDNNTGKLVGYSYTNKDGIALMTINLEKFNFRVCVESDVYSDFGALNIEYNNVTITSYNEATHENSNSSTFSIELYKKEEVREVRFRGVYDDGTPAANLTIEAWKNDYVILRKFTLDENGYCSFPEEKKRFVFEALAFYPVTASQKYSIPYTEKDGTYTLTIPACRDVRFRIHVVDDETGEPIPGLDVRIVTDGVYNAKTDENGDAFFDTTNYLLLSKWSELDINMTDSYPDYREYGLSCDSDSYTVRLKKR